MLFRSLSAGDKLVTLKLRLNGTLAKDEQVQLTLTGSQLNELADGSVNVINDAVLYAETIKSSTIGIGENSASVLGFANYPNPFNETTTFVYSLPFDGVATIEMYDMLGNKVNVVLNETMRAGDHKLTIKSNTLKPGVYTATLSLNSDGKFLKRTIKIICNQ